MVDGMAWATHRSRPSGYHVLCILSGPVFISTWKPMNKKIMSVSDFRLIFFVMIDEKSRYHFALCQRPALRHLGNLEWVG